MPSGTEFATALATQINVVADTPEGFQSSIGHLFVFPFADSVASSIQRAG
jgi:hypothetical protein